MARPAIAASASAGIVPIRRGRKNSTERMNILDAPVGCNAPALDAIHMIEHTRRLQGAALRNQLLMRGLGIARLVGGAALDGRGRTAPNPWKAEAGLADGKHGIL